MRLALKLYVFSIVAALATAGMLGAAALAFRSEHRHSLRLASRHIVKGIWRDYREGASIAEPAHTSPAVVSLYDLRGRLLTSTDKPVLPLPPAPKLAELRERGFAEMSLGVSAHEVRDQGRPVAIGIIRIHDAPSRSALVAWLLALLVALLSAALIGARRLARPLEKIAAVAKQFGAGDLGARVHDRRKDEIGEVGRAFDAMAGRVAGLMTAQQELMASVSHELLTPLARVQVAVDLIADGKTEQGRELVAEIAQDLAELERLVDDVMTVAKLDLSRSAEAAGVFALRRQVLPIASLIEDAVARFRAQHALRELSVELHPPLPELCLDTVLMRRVLDNLLENARKYSEPDTTIRLSARAGDRGVILALSDEGIGIDQADLQKVFVPFFRCDRSRSRATGGVGLGLALAKRVVEAHRGTIEIESDRGRGTTVTLALPASPDSALR